MSDKPSPYDLCQIAIDRSKKATDPGQSPYILDVNYSLHAGKKKSK